MKRDELRALADELETNLYAPHKRAAAVLRQIAEAQPVCYVSENLDGFVSDEYRADPDVFPLYRLPLED